MDNNINLNKALVGTPQINAIDNTETANAVPVPEAATDASVNETDVAPAAPESPKAEAPKASGKRHSVIYLAGGIWKDATGMFWCRDERTNCVTSNTFSDEEFASRPDIQYMISYGAMKDVISE